MTEFDLIKLAREIYVQMVAADPTNWDKQAIARNAIESATQFFLALQSEKAGSAYPPVSLPPLPPPPGSPTVSSEQSQSVYSVLQSLETRKTEGNQMAQGRGMVRQRYFGQEMG